MGGLNKLGISVTRCYYCGESSEILLNTKFMTERNAEKFNKDTDGKVCNMDPCNDCKKSMEDLILLISIDSKLSDDDWDKEDLPNPYRTGIDIWVKKQFIEDNFTDNKEIVEFAIEHRFTFVESVVIEAIIESYMNQHGEPERIKR